MSTPIIGRARALPGPAGPVRVQVALGRSPRLAALLTAAHLGALASAIAALPPLALLPAGLALALSWMDSWRRHVARSAPDAVTAVQIEGQEVTLCRRDGGQETGRAASLFVTPVLVILTVRPAGRRATRSVVILPEATGKQAHRRLRVGLKWGHDRADSPEHV
jgi:hypothetical protein